MKLRLAKNKDAHSLAAIHLECGLQQPGGFMFKLGYPFLKAYYKILLKEEKSIVILAEDRERKVHGFCSGTLAAEEHVKALKQHRVKLFISIIPSLIKNPGLLKDIIERYRYLNSETDHTKFGTTSGPRNEYWAWLPKSNKSLSIHLFKTWLNLVYDFGFDRVRGEVDSINKHIILLHKILGAKVLGNIDLPDGRQRYYVEYVNQEGVPKNN
jgi:hypothetical protein